MKITIKLPDDMSESEVGYYIPAVFDNNVTHYKDMLFDTTNVITYSNNKVAEIRRSKVGYSIEFRKGFKNVDGEKEKK